MSDNSGLSALGAQLLTEAESISDEMQEWRRDFHQFPELAFEENITASKIIKVLESIEGMDVISGFAIPTSVIGILGKDMPGPAVLLRSCMDALAVEEETGLPFSSCMPGLMHACGHDAHMASLLGAAKILSLHRDKLKRKIIFLFQPAGEGKGGAKILVENRFLETFNIENAVALHWWSEIPYGELYLRRGVLTALSDRIHIDIRGTAGHAAEPHMTIDPITIASHTVIAIQTMLTREIDPRDPIVVSFGQIEAGFAYNVIPEQVNLWGTLRAFNPKIRDFVQGRIETIAPAIAKAFRGLASVEYTRNYSQVDNDSEMVNKVLHVGIPFFGEDGIKMLERPLLSGEDFSFFSSCVPSVFMLMGTGLEYGLHHPRYDIPENMLPFSAAWEAYMALTL
ncbi:MAG: M20 family metallopeptidase [Synergistaceae bacterium]|nr:M20 family metallopeptidase [Synergistaceae bacterium]